MNSGDTNELWVVDVGMMEYGQALDLQHHLVAAKKSGALQANLLLLLEHPAVITLGRRGDDSNIVATPDHLAQRGIDIHRIERGGDVTYHGPGQLVGYPIINLRHVPNRQDVGKFVWVIQEAIIRTLAEYEITAERIDKVVGVWVRRNVPSLDPIARTESHRAALREAVNYPDRKIAAIGARVEGWITFHGFALNVTTDLTDFNLIVPCGIEDRGVTSMELELGREVPMAAVKARIATELAEIWGFEMKWVGVEEIEAVQTLMP
jgi:lipoyl(octanoyl) transferase